MLKTDIWPRLRVFSAEEDGVGTAWAMLWTVIFLMFGGLAIDTAFAFRTHQLLQATADAAASAGAVQLWEGGKVNAEAIQYSRYNMPRGLNGNVLVDSDVFVGVWDHTKKKFNPTSVNPDAVKVQTRRTASNGNALPTLLLKLVGWAKFDVASESVAQLLMNPACVDDGIIANGTIDLASNNTFKGICVHGYQGVDVGSNNKFGKYVGPDGTPHPLITVGHPYDRSGKALPQDKWLGGGSLTSLQAANAGLAGNLGTRPGFKSRVAEKTATYISNLYDASSPSFQQQADFQVLSVQEFDALDQDGLSGSYYVNCSGGQSLALNPESKVVSGVTMVTNCRVIVGKGVTLSGVRLATTRAGGNAVTVSSDVTLGGAACKGGHHEAKHGHDGKSEHGGKGGPTVTSGAPSAILAMGNIFTAKGLKIYGSKIIAAGDIYLDIGSNALNGASIQADGDVRLAANRDFIVGSCKVALNDEFRAPYWRIVR